MFDPLDRDILIQCFQLNTSSRQLSEEQWKWVVAVSKHYPVLLLKQKREEFLRRYKLTANFALGMS